MEDKIKLFLQYVKKEIELTKKWDKEDGIDIEADDYKISSLLCVDRIKSFIAYRNIRVEEAWFLKLNRGDHSREKSEKAAEYDSKRSRRHSLALNSLLGLNMFGEKYGLEKFYDGEVLNAEEIESYKNIRIRRQETDFFLQFIDSLSRVPSIKMKEYINEAGLDENISNTFIRELQSGVESVERKYGVEKNLLTDDGEIKFKMDKGEEFFIN